MLIKLSLNYILLKIIKEVLTVHTFMNFKLVKC